MWVLQEGRISQSNVYKVGVLQDSDHDTLDEIIEKGYEIIVSNPNSLPFIKKYGSLEVIKCFLKGVIDGLHEEYILLVFYDEHEILSGASLVSRGRPWYAPEGTIVFNEECSVAFKSGLGLSRALASALEKNAMDSVKLLMFSNANTLNKKMLENTFEKHLGYESYKTFYKEIN